MNLNELSDQEKSVMLGKAMGWRVLETGPSKIICVPVEGQVELIPPNTGHHVPEEFPIRNLYDPANMALSYRLMPWVNEQMANGLDRPDDFDNIINAFNDFHLSVEKWLRGWLDAIYLMVEDGAIEEFVDEQME